MKKIFITAIAFGFIAGCSTISGSVGSLGGSSSAGGNNGDGSSGGRSSGGIFAKKRPEDIVLEQRKVTPDTRVLIAVVNEVKVDKFRGSALIRARGTTDRTGYSDVNLVALNNGLPDENGIVTYEFKGEKPFKDTQPGPTPRSNEVYAGASITVIQMPRVKRIRVIAAQNAITVPK